jgi:hypothetical protein
VKIIDFGSVCSGHYSHYYDHACWYHLSLPRYINTTILSSLFYIN